MKIIQEHVALSSQQPFLISTFHNEEVDLSYPFHQHRYAYELTLTQGISGTRMVGDSTEQFSGTDLVLMAPGLPHCWQDHGVKGSGERRVLVIQFSEALVPMASRQFAALQPIGKALRRSVYGLELLGNEKDKAVGLLNSIKPDNEFRSFLTLLEILATFSKKQFTRKLCHEGYSIPAVDGEGNRLDKILQYIQQHYSRKLPIEEVAAQIHLSPSAFSHYFKKRTLKSFTHYVIELRLGKAAQLLQFTDLPVANVCYQCGFNNLSHFNRSFQKMYQTTPLKFRREASSHGK